MSDSTKSNNLDNLDAGSARYQARTRYNTTEDYHVPQVTNIDIEHQNVHEGNMYSLSGIISALGAGASGYFHGLTNTDTVHFRAANISADGAPVLIEFFEEATVSANGTPLTAYNRRRNSSNTATLQTFVGPTVTADGTLIETGNIPVSGPSAQAGIASLFGTEWVLKSSTNYLIKVTNNDNSPIDVGYNFLWYETGDNPWS